MPENMRIGRGFNSAFRTFVAHIQNVPNIVLTQIEYGDGVIFDLLNEVDGVLYQFVPVEAGYYYLRASLYFAALNINDDIAIQLLIDGAVSASTYKRIHIIGINSIQIASILHVTPVNVITVWGWHNSGVARMVMGNPQNAVFEGFRVH